MITQNVNNLVQNVDRVKGLHAIVASGNPDGMAGAAACILFAANPDIFLVFTQASQVGKIDVENWSKKMNVSEKELNIGIIDLGVNNEGQFGKQETVNFINKVYSCGKILFIADEHGAEAWRDVINGQGHSLNELTIQPKDRGKKYDNEKTYLSSCAILADAFGTSVNDSIKELLHAGDQADQMNYKTLFGEIFNNVCKSKMTDNERREYAVRHVVKFYRENAPGTQYIPDDKIKGWMNEYAVMESNKSKILEKGIDLGNGIFIYDCVAEGPHDATAVFTEAYKFSPIVILKTNVFLEGKLQAGISIATNRKDLNILDTLQKAGIKAGGMPVRANLTSENLDKAIDTIRNAL